MELVYYHAAKGNFGDDLNKIIWDHVLSDRVRRSDRLVLIGIGSILTDNEVGKYASSDRLVAVLGTGTSYGVVPRNMDGWFVPAVRGPLTAAAIGRPEAAITDGAALLASTSMVRAKTGEQRILYVPHHKSLDHGLWREAATLAGFDFVDPRSSVDEVLTQFARAKLVIAEAMHAAIVADTLRIPWIPICASPAFDRFKWLDWTSSLELPLHPIAIGPSSGYEKLRYLRLRRELAVKGVDDLELVAKDPHILKNYLERRYAGGGAAPSAPPLASRHPGARRWVKAVAGAFDNTFVHRAATALHRASETRQYLSEDSIFYNRLERLKDAAISLERKLFP